jgi:hypothetical protein
VDFRSGKAEPCPGIADLQPDLADFFCGGSTQTASAVLYMSIQNRRYRTEKI